MSGIIRSRAVGLTLTAAAVTTGLASPTPHPLLATCAPSVQRAVVQFDVAMMSSVSIAATQPIAADTAAVDDPAAIPRTIAQIAFTAVGIALAPAWYLAFPITLPLAASMAMNSFSVWGGLGTAAGLFYSPALWLAVPFLAGTAVAQAIFPMPTATVTPAAATGSGATSTGDPIRSRRAVGQPVRPAQIDATDAALPRSMKHPASARKSKPAGAAARRSLR